MTSTIEQSSSLSLSSSQIECHNQWLICPECEENIPRIKDIILTHSSKKIYIKYRCRCPLVNEKTVELKQFLTKIKAIDSPNKSHCYNLTHPQKMGVCYCPLCNSWFCHSCLSEHKLNFPSHILSLKPFTISYFCFKHKTNEINQRCITCDTNACELCIKEDHHKHKSISYEKFWEETKQGHQFQSMNDFLDYALLFLTRNDDYKRRWYEKNKDLPQAVINEIDKSFNYNYEINSLLIDFSSMILSNFFIMKTKQNLTVVYNVVNYLRYNPPNSDLNQKGTSRNLINHYKNCYIHHLTIEFKSIWSTTAHSDSIKGLVKIYNGNIVSYSDDLSMKIWDVYSLKCVETIANLDAKIIQVLQLKCDLLLVLFNDSKMKLWKINEASDYPSKMIDVVQLETGLIKAIETASEMIVLLTEKDILVYKHNDDKLEKVKSIGINGDDSEFKTMICLHNNNLVLTVSNKNEICIWKIDEGKCLKRHQYQDTIKSLSQLDNDTIAFAIDKEILILSNDLSHELYRLKGHNTTISFIIELDDERLVSVANGTMLIWTSLKEATFIEMVNDTTNKIYHIAELEDLTLVTIWSNHSIKLWNMATLRCISILEGHKAPIHSLLYLTDGKLMTASDDQMIRIWN